MLSHQRWIITTTLVFLTLGASASADEFETISRRAMLYSLAQRIAERIEQEELVVASPASTTLEIFIEDQPGAWFTWLHQHLLQSEATPAACKNLVKIFSSQPEDNPLPPTLEQAIQLDANLLVWVDTALNEFKYRKRIVEMAAEDELIFADLKPRLQAALEILDGWRDGCYELLEQVNPKTAAWAQQIAEEMRSKNDVDIMAPTCHEEPFSEVRDPRLRSTLQREWGTDAAESVCERAAKYPLRFATRTVDHLVVNTVKSVFNVPKSLFHLARAPFTDGEFSRSMDALSASPINVIDFGNRSISNIGAVVKETRNAAGRRSSRIQICSATVADVDNHPRILEFLLPARHIELFCDEDPQETKPSIRFDCADGIILSSEPESVVVERVTFMKKMLGKTDGVQTEYNFLLANCGMQTKGPLGWAGAASSDFSNLGIGAELGTSMCGTYLFAPRTSQQIAALQRRTDRHIDHLRQLIADFERGGGINRAAYLYFRDYNVISNLGTNAKLQLALSAARGGSQLSRAFLRRALAYSRHMNNLLHESESENWVFKPLHADRIRDMSMGIDIMGLLWLSDQHAEIGAAIEELTP